MIFSHEQKETDNQDNYSHYIHRDEMHTPIEHLHKIARDDVYRSDNLEESQLSMLLHTFRLLLVATDSALLKQR